MSEQSLDALCGKIFLLRVVKSTVIKDGASETQHKPIFRHKTPILAKFELGVDLQNFWAYNCYYGLTHNLTERGILFWHRLQGGLYATHLVMRDHTYPSDMVYLVEEFELVGQKMHVDRLGLCVRPKPRIDEHIVDRPELSYHDLTKPDGMNWTLATKEEASAVSKTLGRSFFGYGANPSAYTLFLKQLNTAKSD